jgi:hypothetical protein
MTDEPEIEEPSSGEGGALHEASGDDASREASEDDASREAFATSSDADEPSDPLGDILYRVVWSMVFVAIPIYIVLRITVL